MRPIETQILSFWRNFRQWLLRKLSKWQLPSQPLAKIESKWWHLRFSAWVNSTFQHHDDVIKWKYFPRYWPFVREIHRSPVNFPHKGQWRGALMFTLICARKNGWVNNGEAGDLRRYLAHYDVIVMWHPTIYKIGTYDANLWLEDLISIITHNNSNVYYI